MPELDTLRGIAVLVVVLFHGFGFLVGPYQLRQYSWAARLFIGATWLGWMGVNLFFVLSGFLITGILLREKEKPKYYSRFYWRRALRILPAYYLLLLLLPLICSIPGFPRQVGWHFLGFAFIYAANVVDLFGVQMQYGPLWSLAVEEHFYLVWPTVVKALSSTTLIVVALVLIAISPALRVWTPGMAGVTWKNLDGLAMGAISSVIALRYDRRGIRLLCLGSFGAALCGLVLLFPAKV